MKSASIGSIQRFWSWFRDAAPSLGKKFDNEKLLAALDSRVSNLGPVSWELGPGIKAPNALTISPDGKRSALGLTKRIVAHAPILEDWEFHYAKPPKQWGLRFSVQRDNDMGVEIDARKWRYVLFRFPDGSFDIVIVAPNLSAVDEELRTIAADLLVEGILGEGQRLELVRNIDVVTEFDSETLPNAREAGTSEIGFLSEHLARLSKSGEKE